MPKKVNLAKLRESAEDSANEAKREMADRFTLLIIAEDNLKRWPNLDSAQKQHKEAKTEFECAKIQYDELNDEYQVINNLTLTLDKTYTSDADIKAQQQALAQVQVIFDLKARISKLAMLSDQLGNYEHASEMPEIINSLKSVEKQYTNSFQCMGENNVCSLNKALQENLADLQKSCKSAEKACEAYVDEKVEKTSRLGALFKMILWVLVGIPTLIASVIAAPLTLGGSLVVGFAPFAKATDQLKQVITGETNESRDKVSSPREIQSNIKAALKNLKSENPVQTKEDPGLDETIQGHMTPS